LKLFLVPNERLETGTIDDVAILNEGGERRRGGRPQLKGDFHQKSVIPWFMILFEYRGKGNSGDGWVVRKPWNGWLAERRRCDLRKLGRLSSGTKMKG